MAEKEEGGFKVEKMGERERSSLLNLLTSFPLDTDECFLLENKNAIRGMDIQHKVCTRRGWGE